MRTQNRGFSCQLPKQWSGSFIPFRLSRPLTFSDGARRDTHGTKRTEARTLDSWSNGRSILSNYSVIMVKRMVTSKDNHRASLSTLVRTRFLPLVL